MYFVREFMHQLMEALEYVHQKGVSTNDIITLYICLDDDRCCSKVI